MKSGSDGFSPISVIQELETMSGTIYNSCYNDTIRKLSCQEV
jgi:hypothetical protein